MRTFVLLFVMTWVGVGAAVAQQSAADCADIEDNRERLDCYDRFFSGRGGEAAPAAESRATPDRAEAARPAARPERERARVAARERTPESAQDRFGKDQSMLEFGGEEMASTALGSFRYWREGQRIELENGQVWEITNDTNLFHRATNPRVTIEKGFFSSFYLHIDGVSKALRVRRIR
jgi:hypothetical protein